MIARPFNTWFREDFFTRKFFDHRKSEKHESEHFFNTYSPVTWQLGSVDTRPLGRL